MFANLSGAHLIAILAVVLLLFGAPKLPALARSLGQSLRILKQEVSDSGGVPTEPESAVTSETSQGAGVANAGDPPRTPTA